MRFFKNLIPQSIKNVYHLFQAITWSAWYGFPARKLKIVGVTGTDGKTTTTQFIASILEKAGYKVAMASTINFKLGEETWVNTSKFTTLSSRAVQRFLSQALREKAEYVVLEISSHALDQNRVWGIRYEAAVITNITREHLDYHKTMARYRKAKKRLFDHAKVAIVNMDMDGPEEFLKDHPGNSITYSQRDSGAQVLAQEMTLTLDGSTFTVDGQAFRVHTPGAFNVENALAAIAVGVSQRIPFATMSLALEAVRSVPGRMEKVSNTRGIDIVIDYAVTPNALEKLYSLLAQTRAENAKIIAVFGACGDRDRGKRPLMGSIVSSYADIVILTNEDPYFENPHRIIHEIAQGIEGKKRGKNFFQVFNRRKAIERALRLAQAGDIVAVTGKGAEETMAIGDKRIPWNDKKVIQELLSR